MLQSLNSEPNRRTHEGKEIDYKARTELQEQNGMCSLLHCCSYDPAQHRAWYHARAQQTLLKDKTVPELSCVSNADPLRSQGL